MRINAHAHIFNLRAVFTKETLHILLTRLKLEGMPKSILEVLYDELEKYVSYEIDAEAIFNKLDDKYEATRELTEFFEKLKVNDASIDIQIDGALGKLGKAASTYLRDKIIDLYDLDEEGEIRQDWLDFVEYLRIALQPTIEKVADEVMKRMGDEDALVALMMDITDGHDDDTQVRKQMLATSDAALAYPGRIFPFYMVNPARPNHFALMKEAIENHGFWGVKLYPSLGYRVDSPQMKEVFAYCADNDIPVLSHCTDGGFNKNTQTAGLADPAHWRGVMQEFSGLKVCFGHFGSDNNLIQSQIHPESWTQTIIDLMQVHEGVYTDIGFHDAPMIGSTEAGMDKKTARKNYEANLKMLLRSSPVKDRILFGTDYWMVRTVTDDDDYWAFYKKMLTPAQFKTICEDNPANFLGLPGTAAPAERLLRHHLGFFKSKKMKVQREPAKWLSESARTILGPEARFVVMGSGPTWSRNNNVHLILYEYLRGTGQFRKADRDANLTFEEYGRFKLANLRYFDESPEPAIFETALRGVASDINKSFRKRYAKWTSYNTANGITEKIARQRLIAALGNADWYIYQLAELCDQLYVYNV